MLRLFLGLITLFSMTYAYECNAVTIYENEYVHLTQGSITDWPPVGIGEVMGSFLSFNRRNPSSQPSYTSYVGPFLYFPENPTYPEVLELTISSTNLSYEYFVNDVEPGTLISPYYDIFSEEYYISYTGTVDRSDLNFRTNDEDIYLGFATGKYIGGSSIRNYLVFGWVRLEMVPIYPEPPLEDLYNIYPKETVDFVYDNYPIERFYEVFSLDPAPGLRLVESVIAYDSHGIVVGTTDAIPAPEPYTLLTMLTGLTVGLLGTHRSPTA